VLVKRLQRDDVLVKRLQRDDVLAMRNDYLRQGYLDKPYYVVAGGKVGADAFPFQLIVIITSRFFQISLRYMNGKIASVMSNEEIRNMLVPQE
jgi:hypothetical protein